MARNLPLLLTFIFCACLCADEAVDLHYQRLVHLEETHAPLLIVFSGPPGIGKTTLAKTLEEKLRAVRISSDEARDLFRQFGQDPFDAPQLFAHLEQLVTLVIQTSDNHRIIGDFSIDRCWDKVSRQMHDAGIPVVVLRLTAPLDIVVARLWEREDNPAPFLETLLERLAEYASFSCSDWIEVDTTLSVEDEAQVVLQSLEAKGIVTEAL